jgi:hypothetical protein
MESRGLGWEVGWEVGGKGVAHTRLWCGLCGSFLVDFPYTCLVVMPVERGGPACDPHKQAM